MKKTTQLICAALALVFMLSACQQTGGGQASSSTPAASSTASVASSAAASSTASATETAIPNFNPTGYPICPEKVTLRVLFSANADMPADLHDIPLIQNDEKVMNVHIDYIMVPSTGFTEKKNLMLATGDLPDIIESAISTSDLTKYGPEGTLIPMQDLINDYAPNYKKVFEEIPYLQAFITAPDGNIYGLGRVNSGPWMTSNGVGAINKAWLDKLGLQVPKNVDEFHDVLTAFKTKDPNGNGQADEVPFAFALTDSKSLTGNNGLGYIMHSFGIPVGIEAYTDVKDGKVICLATLPEMKEAISYLSTLYTENLIDMEGFTLDNSAYRAKLNNEPGIVGYTQVWDLNDIVSNPANNEALEYMPLLEGPDGRKPLYYKNPLPGIARGWATITKACKTPEVAMRWLDYFMDETNAIEHIEGPIGVRVLENSDGTLSVRKPPEGLSVAKDRFTNCNAGILAMPPSAYRNRLKLPSTDEKVKFVESIPAELTDPDPMVPAYYTADEATEMSQLQTDIVTYIDRKLSEWIMNGNIEKEWDAYLAEIEKVGLTKWLTIKQASYDRFMAATK